MRRWVFVDRGRVELRSNGWRPAASVPVVEPSGRAIDGAHVSYNDGTSCIDDGNPGCAVTDLVAVGTKPAGDARWGQSDLAGNVWEWPLDWYAGYVNPCTNCANLTVASLRMVCGGGFANNAALLRTGYRLPYSPTARAHDLGVRCARNAP